MKTYFKQLSNTIQIELEVIDLDGCDISLEESASMIEFFKKCLSDLRNFFLSKESISVEEEIVFFKEMKPEVLGLLLYFNKIHNIELKRPTGSNDTQREYYESELSSIPTSTNATLSWCFKHEMWHSTEMEAIKQALGYPIQWIEKQEK